MRLVRYGFESFLEFNDPLHPQLHRGSHETIKIIHENPDNLYLGARVDGRSAYRVCGTLGTARWMSFNVHAGAFGAGGRGTAEALDARSLELGPDRSFELFLGGERGAAANWLPLPPDAGSLIVRQTFADRASERPSRARDRAARRGERARAARARAGRPRARRDAGAAARAGRHGALVVGRPREVEEPLRRGDARRGGDLPRPRHPLPRRLLRAGARRGARRRGAAAACDYWMFVLSNHWLETLDYTRHRITLNNHSAVLEPDGTREADRRGARSGPSELARHGGPRARHDRRALGGARRRGRGPGARVVRPRRVRRSARRPACGCRWPEPLWLSDGPSDPSRGAPVTPSDRRTPLHHDHRRHPRRRRDRHVPRVPRPGVARRLRRLARRSTGTRRRSCSATRRPRTGTRPSAAPTSSPTASSPR